VGGETPRWPVQVPRRRRVRRFEHRRGRLVVGLVGPGYTDRPSWRCRSTVYSFAFSRDPFRWFSILFFGCIGCNYLETNLRNGKIQIHATYQEPTRVNHSVEKYRARGSTLAPAPAYKKYAPGTRGRTSRGARPHRTLDCAYVPVHVRIDSSHHDACMYFVSVCIFPVVSTNYKATSAAQ
jgi:hypothetical protein